MQRHPCSFVQALPVYVFYCYLVGQGLRFLSRLVAPGFSDARTTRQGRSMPLGARAGHGRCSGINGDKAAAALYYCCCLIFRRGVYRIVLDLQPPHESPYAFCHCMIDSRSASASSYFPLSLFDLHLSGRLLSVVGFSYLRARGCRVLLLPNRASTISECRRIIGAAPGWRAGSSFAVPIAHAVTGPS